MTACNLLVDAPPSGTDAAPKRYLRAFVAVARSARSREYAVVLASGAFFRTDRLGALAVRALIHGQSDVEAMELVERIEPGAGTRAGRLIDVFDEWSAMTRVPPSPTGSRRLRRLAAIAIGWALTIVAPLIRVAPTGLMARICGVLPGVDRHIWRSTLLTILNNLRTSVHADWPEPELLAIGRRCTAAPSRNYVFMYLTTVLSPERLGRVVDRLFDRNSADDLAVRLNAAGATICVFLHGPLCVAVPNALRTRGLAVVRAVVPWTHGSNVGKGSGPLRDLLGDLPEMVVSTTDPLAQGAMLRHLKAGRSIFTALDERARGRQPVVDVEMCGRWFPRNDGPAWLAVRSGRPIILCTVHSSPSGVVITASPLLCADRSLPLEGRVADLSERLYDRADAAIREYPERWGRGWAVWGYGGSEPRRFPAGPVPPRANA